MKKKNIINKLPLIIPLLILTIISLINMKIIGINNETYNSYFLKQVLWFILGFISMVIIIIFKPKILFKYSKYLYLLNVLLLILVLFFGKTVNGSTAWFNLYFFSFQPSELMKLTLTLYLSETLSHYKEHTFKQELKFILKAFFITLIPSLFVFLEPDTGAIIIYFLIMIGVILVYKLNFKWYLFISIIIIIALLTFSYLYIYQKDLLIKLIGTSFFYRIDRILTFVNNDSFQLDRALTAIGISNIFKGGNYIYIPEAPTDFIIALSINNLGIISFIIILISFIILDFYFLFKLFKAKNTKFKMFFSSFIVMFIFAQIQNIGMNLGLFPIIGLPLPFLSYGGTNIIVYFMFLGILASKSKNF